MLLDYLKFVSGLVKKQRKMTNPIFKNNIITFPPVDLPDKLECLGITLFNKMLDNREAVAQVDGITGEKETYSYLLQKCVRTAIRMRMEGIKSGDVISICSLNNLNTCVPYLAGLFLNAKTASLDPSLSVDDTVYLMKQTHPKMIFVDQEGLGVIEEALRETRMDCKIVVYGDTERHLNFAQFLESSREEKTFLPIRVGINETALILFSSGTGGLPKGIAWSHYGVLGNIYQKGLPTRPGRSIASFASMYWASTIIFLHSTILSCGIRLVYPKFDQNAVWTWIEQSQVDSMFLAPNQILAMCENGRPADANTTSLKMLLVSGGSLAAKQLDNVMDCLKGTVIRNTYGQTELSGGGTMFKLTLPHHLRLCLNKPYSCGTGVPGTSYKIVDPDTEVALGPNATGELRVKSKFVMNGYYNMDSSDCWDSDGFIKTGDVAYYDEDFCFFLVDRIKEIFKYQSWHIAPAQIESVILTHPAVETAMVMGKPHPIDGDHPIAIVVLKNNAIGSVTAEEIERYVEERVDDRKKLRGGVRIVEKLPFTPSSKINRHRVKNLLLQGKL